MKVLTAGESHGPQLTAIIEGLPAHMPVDVDKINEQLRRRQIGYGRGRRMSIEKDEVHLRSGVRHGVTTGAPITLVIENKDYIHWKDIMSVQDVLEGKEKRRVSRPRPGHADLAGGLKYQHRDLRNVLERSSARETAMRVAVGALLRQLLESFDVKILGHVLSIGGVSVKQANYNIEDIEGEVIGSDVRCYDPVVAEQMRRRIDEAKEHGDTIGGVIEVIAEGLPAGLGTYVHWDRKLDARLAQAIMSIPAIKGIEFGDGFPLANYPGSSVQDEIVWSEQIGYVRKSNHLGGFEGGMTTGMPIILRAVMKPLPTLYKPLMSVDIDTKEPHLASVERSDACAVPPASVIAENIVAWILTEAFLEKFSADTYPEIVQQYKTYCQKIKEF